MKRTVLLLVAVILLYLIPSVILQAVYGPSYGFLSGENSWIPDGQGGWTAHGTPSGEAPTTPSVNVPIALRYLPIFLPAVLLILFYLTPLSKLLQEKKPPIEDSGESGDPHDAEQG
ncbi:MAG TPA: hypothetical protein VJ983_10360 [candidate division Zixibacteria bacterium]|nr:hypothetical protein [candidate division Zixibacteria bacterium]